MKTQQALTAFRKASEEVTYYETNALAQAQTMNETANRQFENGELNYLEWVLVTDNAYRIRSEYIEAVRQYNLALADLRFYLPDNN